MMCLLLELWTLMSNNLLLAFKYEFYIRMIYACV